MNQLQQSLEQAVQSYHRKAFQISEYIFDHKFSIAEVFEELESLNSNLIRADADGASVDLHFAGDKSTLNAIFKVFRSLGYEPSRRPGEEPEEHFATYFNHPEKRVRFWLSFASNKCTRTQIGVETKEVPIMKVVCE